MGNNKTFKVKIPYAESVLEEKREFSYTFEVEAGDEKEAVEKALLKFYENKKNSDAPWHREPIREKIEVS